MGRGNGSQKRSNGENGGIGKENSFLSVLFVASVAPFLGSDASIYLRWLEVQLKFYEAQNLK
jgi:hypothetical protein